MKEAAAFSPAHITGFFQICDESADLLLKGSRGAGFSIDRGVTTKVSVEAAPKTSFTVKINGQASKSAEVSEYVLNAILPQVDGKYRILIEHEAEVPIGAGFGTSGAGALSLSLALDEVFDLDLPRVKLAQVAHAAEVECKTGLGTVIAEACGGLEIRVKPGAPGVGEVQQIPFDADYVSVCLPFTPISKKGVLTSEVLRSRINAFDGKLVEELAAQPTPESFMRLSRRFAEHVGLISERLRKILDETDEADIVCSMAMFGENLFTLVKQDSLNGLLRIFRRYAPSENDIIVAHIDLKGARVL